MVSWRDPGNNAKKEVADFPSDAVTTPFGQHAPTTPAAAPVQATQPAPAPASKPAAKESVIAADLSIEGKIQGAGHIRIAGKFKGDVDVKGDLTVEQGAKLDGSVRAEKVTLSGELDGNILSARRVDLLASSAMHGDIKADDLTIASGARLRGQVECGAWEGKAAGKSESKPESKKEGAAAA
ncbi:polymer-forming cytoskeletal family protein [Lysobacter pythonis]|uniref:Polymer-forming cytoskeletal family protein n=1 Tax=Solilutibacter pythonis TaxID=2483112 RepID=A0A3M2HR34_9GAMM|nr:polymer-forming cytoskeletal protein [Lysobacter pythonis]RMH90805.1 polymer-forming cytoskeletal family protein [Lysobacter pythonis]